MPEIKDVSKLLYLLAAIPALQKHSKLETMRGCNLLFYNKSGPITVWMAAVELRISFEKRDDCKCFFQRNTVPLKCMILSTSLK